jgi:hypothetical protein
MAVEYATNAETALSLNGLGALGGLKSLVEMEFWELFASKRSFEGEGSSQTEFGNEEL